MDYLTTFDNIAYTPAWYYKQFPGFYSIDSYKILASWTGGCRTPEQYLKDLEEQQNSMDNNDKKRKRDENKNDGMMVEDFNVLDENGIHPEFEREHPEDHPALCDADAGRCESGSV